MGEARREPVVISNVGAARPAPGAMLPGDFFLDTDTGVVQQSNGREWSAVSPGETVFDVREYGLLTTAATTAAAINTALAAAEAQAGTTCGVVQLPPGAITTTGDHEIPAGCRVRGWGAGVTKVTHTGNNACFHSAPNVVDVTSGVAGVHLIGNNGANAIGVRHGDQWGFRLDDVLIEDYTAGTGWLFLNDARWTEGTEGYGVRIRNCAVGISLARSAESTFDSFGYTRLLGFGINVPEDGVGLFLGDNGDNADGHYIYHCDLLGNIWLEGDNAVAIQMSANTEGDYNRLFVTGESADAVTGHTTWGANPAYFQYTGEVRVASGDEDLPGNVTPNLMVMRDDGKPALTVRASASPNAAVLRVQSHNGADDVIRLYHDGTVQADYLQFNDDSGPFIMAAAGSPEGAIAAGVGSLFLRTDGGATTTLYVKTSGTGNTGWTAK